jgi:hypothetical protein
VTTDRTDDAAGSRRPAPSASRGCCAIGSWQASAGLMTAWGAVQQLGSRGDSDLRRESAAGSQLKTSTAGADQEREFDELAFQHSHWVAAVRSSVLCRDGTTGPAVLHVVPVTDVSRSAFARWHILDGALPDQGLRDLTAANRGGVSSRCVRLAASIPGSEDSILKGATAGVREDPGGATETVDRQNPGGGSGVD